MRCPRAKCRTEDDMVHEAARVWRGGQSTEQVMEQAEVALTRNASRGAKRWACLHAIRCRRNGRGNVRWRT